MKFTLIDPGLFEMGSPEGEPDERPAHEVRISKSFHISDTPVTNAQYEQFDPAHRELRGKRGLSKGDGEAVIFVSWYDAEAFCRWLSKKEGRPYRLPTEAEWEYACRAGTRSAYNTGDSLPEEHLRSQCFNWNPVPVDLTVGRTSPNAWGLRDMHGLVEEWCLDWYAPYQAIAQTDPAGPADGTFKVSRGGSHNTDVRFLRSSCRFGTLPEDRSWLIGFRIVQAEMTVPSAWNANIEKLWQKEVSQSRYDWIMGSDCRKPLFTVPKPYVIPPPEGNGEPFHRHNHCPSITWCDNGDLLAVWFSTVNESGREMAILASRLRGGKSTWEPAGEFFNAPSRNMTGSSLFNDGRGTIYHFNGLGTNEGWANLALVLRTSQDNGATWSRPRFIHPEHQRGNQVISGTSMTAENIIVQPCDADWKSDGGTVVHLGLEGGKEWIRPCSICGGTEFAEGKTGGRIAGIHAGVVSLENGALMALGRGDSIDGRMPMSLSTDMGRSWSYHASCFPPIGCGQRLILMRLAEGPILLISFTDEPSKIDREGSGGAAGPSGLIAKDAEGKEDICYGMYAALSYDEGKSWPLKRIVSDRIAPVELDGGGWTGKFILDRNHAEPKGYLAATQSPDGMVHLLSSRLHYSFNMRWLEA